MTVIEQSLVSELQNNAGLIALINGRVYHAAVPQNATFPAVTYQRVSTPRILTHDTAGATGTLTNKRFQIDVYAATNEQAVTIAEAIRAALHGKTGTLGVAPNQLTVRAVLVDNEESEILPELGLCRMITEYIIWQME